MYLFLVGPPGVGKSTLAPLLAGLLAADVVEIDRATERRARRSNRRIIEDDGIEAFRDLETRVLASLRPTPAWTVVDTGGGTAIRPGNRARMRELGLVVGLRGSLERISGGIAATMGKRPYQDLAPVERARQALRTRRAAYRDVDVGFDVDGLTPPQTARAIVAWLAAGRGVRIDVGAPSYPVLIRAGLHARVGAHLADLGWRGRVALVSEPTALRLHGAQVRRSLERAGMTVTAVRAPTGERAKSVRAVARIWEALAAGGVGRDGGVVALGGGALGDAAAFAAATYARGIRVAQVPTTLLAMVDAAIGGKSAIDIAAGKNLVGAFHDPDAVLADVTALRSLPRRQLASGLAEVVKCAFLCDRAAVAHVERGIEGVLRGELGATLTTVTLAAEVKASVVTADPRERGPRALLNFGHTMGHACEASSEYRVTHGEAVAIGMVYAAALSESLGLAEPSLRAGLERVLRRAGLPVRARIPRAAWALLERDKKARRGTVRWILPRRVGRFSEVTDVGARALERAARVVEGR